MMNWKEFGRKQSCSNEGTTTDFVLTDSGRSRKTSDRKVGVSVEIRAEHLLNTSQEGYRYAKPVRWKHLMKCYENNGLYISIFNGLSWFRTGALGTRLEVDQKVENVGETRLRLLGNVESGLRELKVKRWSQRANYTEERVLWRICSMQERLSHRNSRC
jgi:hypothetical protein